MSNDQKEFVYFCRNCTQSVWHWCKYICTLHLQNYFRTDESSLILKTTV